MISLWQDVRFGCRMLMKNPGFAVVVVLTLGLGIGANTAIFSVVNMMMLRPLPVRDPEQLVVLAVSHQGSNAPYGLSWLDIKEFRAQSSAFEGITCYRPSLVGLSADNRAERIAVSYVAGNYFTLLGLEPVAGRLFLPTEGDVAGADSVLVVSHKYWKRRFGGDPSAVGKAVRINGRTCTIVGVAPESFHGTYTMVDMEAFLPLGMAPFEPDLSEILKKRDAPRLHTLGRLKRGTSLNQALASLEVTAQQLALQYPETNKGNRMHLFWETQARPEEGSSRGVPLVAGVFLGLVALVLLVACVNVTNILIVRATIRKKELVIRAALGAARTRLLRQLLTESVLLAILGGGAGILLGQWASRLLGSIHIPGDIPVRMDFSFDWRVFAYASVIALASGLTAGVVPALRASRMNLNEGLRESGRGPSGAGRHRMRDALVVAQVAGSLVLLISAGLFVRSLANAEKVELGFRPDHVMNFSMDPGQQGYDEMRTRAFYKDIAVRVRSLPGVESASLAVSVPLGYNNNFANVLAEGSVLPPNENGPSAWYNVVDAAYIRTMRVPLLGGRWFNPYEEEARHPVAVINETMARRLWPGQDAIGRRFRFQRGNGTLFEVIGLTRDGKYSWIYEDLRPAFFVTHSQVFNSQHVIHIRTSVEPESLAQAVLGEIRTLDPMIPVYDVTTMQDALGGGNAFFLTKMGASFASALGLLGLLLAVVGLYGVVSFSASQRTQEIGIRIALGAERRDILRLVVGHGLGLVSVGAAAGIAATLGLTRFLASMLFNVRAWDPLTYAGVTLVLASVALAACYIPARRATRVDPMVALRYE